MAVIGGCGLPEPYGKSDKNVDPEREKKIDDAFRYQDKMRDKHSSEGFAESAEAIRELRDNRPTQIDNLSEEGWK